MPRKYIQLMPRSRCRMFLFDLRLCAASREWCLADRQWRHRLVEHGARIMWFATPATCLPGRRSTHSGRINSLCECVPPDKLSWAGTKRACLPATDHYPVNIDTACTPSFLAHTRRGVCASLQGSLAPRRTTVPWKRTLGWYLFILLFFTSLLFHLCVGCSLLLFVCSGEDRKLLILECFFRLRGEVFLCFSFDA